MRVPAWRSLALAVLAVVAVATATWIGHLEPAPATGDAPVDAFSAARARAVEERVLGDGRPHPVGTDANRAVRDRVIAELARAGLAATVQREVGCGRGGACAWVENVVAHVEGTERGPSVLLSAHYDGVGAGPGASDDGAGVAAVIEVARAIGAGARPRNTIVLLVDDGEERGLLGAEAFARAHPLARDVAFAVNLEARGSHGPSTIFETGGDDAWLLGIARRALARPVTSSLLYEVYRRLPNDTDFSVLRDRLGVRGFNLAYSRRVGQYHTPRDDLAHASLGSLQHHGDQALALVRALAAADLASAPRGDAAWFDLFGRAIVVYPLGASGPIAAVALAILAAAFARRRADLRPRGIVLGAIFVPAAVASAAVIAHGAGRVLVAAGAIPAPFVARPLAAEVALALVGFAAVAGLALALRGLADAESAAIGLALGFGAIACVLAVLAPRVAYLALVPALAGGVAAHAPTSDRFRGVRLGAVPVACGVAISPLLLDLGAGIGLAVPAAQGAVAALFACGFAPVLGIDRAVARAASIALSIGAICALGRAASTPPFDEDAPQRVNLVRVEDATSREAKWAVDAAWGRVAWGAPSAALVAALGPAARVEPRAPWDPGTWIAVPARPLGAAPPELTVASVDARRVAGRVRSARGATSLRLYAPPGTPIAALRLEGAARAQSAGAGWRTWSFEGVPPEGIAIEVDRAGPGALTIVLEDRLYGLASDGGALDLGRGRAAAPTQDGDLDVVRRTLTID